MVLEALVNRFGWQTEQQQETLASCMDAKNAAKAQGLAEFQEFWSTCIGKIKEI